MSDYRQKLTGQIERSLSTMLDPDVCRQAMNKILVIMKDYEVSERCTDLAVYDDTNDRILRQYLACLAVEGKSKKTVKNYGLMISRFFAFVGKPVQDISKSDVRCFLAYEKERGLKDVSVENERSYISAIFKWATAEELIDKDPTASVKPVKYQKPDKTPFSPVELDALRQACKDLKERAIVELLVSSGIRVEELCNLDVSDIDFQAMEVHVRNGKGGKDRVTYISEVARVYLQKYLISRKETDEILIRSRKGRYTPSGVWVLLSKIGAAAGMKHVFPHRFRHTLASSLAASGMPIQEIQEILGHSNINTTMKYVHVNVRKVKASYEQHIA